MSSGFWGLIDTVKAKASEVLHVIDQDLNDFTQTIAGDTKEFVKKIQVKDENDNVEPTNLSHKSVLDYRIMELNSTILTITTDPEEEEFSSFKSTFNLKANQELIDTLLCKYSELEKMHSEYVPKSLDETVFWCRYLFRYNEVMKEDQKRREALQNVLQNAEVEEKLTWDDDEEESTNQNPEQDKEKEENKDKENTIQNEEDEKEKVEVNNIISNNEDDIPILSPTPPPTPPSSTIETTTTTTVTTTSVINDNNNIQSNSIETPPPKDNSFTSKRINELITDSNNNIISPIQPEDSEKNLIISTPIKTPEEPNSGNIENIPEPPSVEVNTEESAKIPPSTPPTTINSNNNNNSQTNKDDDDDWADWD